MPFGKLIKICLLFLFTSQAAFSAEYDFPYTKDGLLPSLLSAIAQPEKTHAAIKQFILRPDRSKIPLLEGRNGFQYGILKQPHPAPLVFVMPGTGGFASSPLALTLAEQIYRLGYHVITVSNTFSWQFAISASSTGLVGYPADDAADLYSALKKLDAHVKATEGLQVTGYGLVSYSLGGLVSAFVAKVDNQERYFNFKRIVLINPPLDMAFAIGQVDAFYGVGKNLTQQQKNSLIGYAIGVGQQLINRPVNDEYYLGLDKILRLNSAQLKFLVGNSFKDSLNDVIFVSQQVNDIGVLKKPASYYHRQDRYDEIAQISFTDYLEKFVIPQATKRYGFRDRKSLMESGNIGSLANFLQKSTNVYLMHNENDFLLGAHQLDSAREIFGARAYIYPYGGHMGNFWFQKNKNDLAEILSGI